MTDTYNPICERKLVPFWHPLSLRIRPVEDLAYVFVQHGKPPVTLWPDDLQTAWQIRWSTHELMYVIDTSEHSIGFSCTLPSDNDVLEFRADVQLTCQVHKPDVIVRRNITDASTALQPSLIRIMSKITRNSGISIQQRSNTEAMVEQEVEKQEILVGFRITSFSLRLALDDEERKHLRGLYQIERDTHREVKEAKLWQLRDYNDIERRKLSIIFYNELIQKGYGHLVFLYLAQHPNEIQRVIQLLGQMQRDEQKHWLDALNKLQEHDVLEEHHLQELRDYILTQLTGRKRQDIVLDKLEEATANGKSSN